MRTIFSDVPIGKRSVPLNDVTTSEATGQSGASSTGDGGEGGNLYLSERQRDGLTTQAPPVHSGDDTGSTLRRSYDGFHSTDSES